MSPHVVWWDSVVGRKPSLVLSYALGNWIATIAELPQFNIVAIIKKFFCEGWHNNNKYMYTYAHINESF